MDTSELASSLRSVISALHKGLRKQIYSVNRYSMTEIETIGHLFRHNSLLPSELAGLTRIKTQSMSQILKKMEMQGVIVRTLSNEDKRKVYISLTSYGKTLVEKTRYDRDEWLKGRIEESLAAHEKTLLETVIPILKRLAEPKS